MLLDFNMHWLTPSLRISKVNNGVQLRSSPTCIQQHRRAPLVWLPAWSVSDTDPKVDLTLEANRKYFGDFALLTAALSNHRLALVDELELEGCRAEVLDDPRRVQLDERWATGTPLGAPLERYLPRVRDAT